MPRFAWLPVLLLAASCSISTQHPGCQGASQVPEADCWHAVQAAQSALPDPRPGIDHIVVTPGCPQWMPCSASLASQRLTVEFWLGGAATEPPDIVLVDRATWNVTYVGRPPNLG